MRNKANKLIGLWLCCGVLFPGLVAASFWGRNADDSVRKELESLAEKNGIDPDPAVPKSEPIRTEPERNFMSWFAKTPDFSRLDGFWSLVSEAQDGKARNSAQGLKTESGLERTLMVSVTGKRADKTFTSIVLGKNLNSINRKEPQEDHSTSTVEFDISSQFMMFTLEERFFDGMIGFSSFQTWTHRYLCRNYKHGSHLVCHVRNTCVSSEKGGSCGDQVSFQDFERVEK